MTLPPLTPEQRAANVAKMSASPLGPGLHWVNSYSKPGSLVRSACDCAIGTEHDGRGVPERLCEWPRRGSAGIPAGTHITLGESR